MANANYFSYPAPLAVAFHKWEDQSFPKLQYTCFCSILWTNESDAYAPSLKNSEAWGDPYISSVLLCGSDCGVIVAYKFHASEGSLLDVCPLSLICGHSARIVSIIRSDSLIYRCCAASLSVDGTLCIVSVEDLTVVLNRPALFSEGSIGLATHESNRRLLLAAQTFGTIEIADVYDGVLVMKISGFSSIINRLQSHRTLHSVSCADGSLAVFTVVSVENMEPQCLFSVKIDVEKNFSLSLLSPDLTYNLIVCPEKWLLFDSDKPLFEKKIARESDYFVEADWVSSSRFYLHTLGGHVEIWEVEGTGNSQIFNRVDGLFSKFHVTMDGQTRSMTTMNFGPASDKSPLNNGPPKLVTELHLSSDGIIEPTIVTVDGFVVTAPDKSCLKIYEGNGKCHTVSLANYFKAQIRARCAVGDPVKYEARICVDSHIYIQDFQTPIGKHDGAFRLYAPPVSDSVFSFAENGSIRQWSVEDLPGKSRKMAEYCDMYEPVCKVKWIDDDGKHWMVCIGNENSFSVIDTVIRKSVLLCSGHNSRILDVVYSEGLLHARCESSSIYTWNIEGQLVSKRKAQNLKVIGQGSLPCLSRSEPALSKQAASEEPLFSKIVPLNIPNCQTFALVFDVSKFLESYTRENCESLDISDKRFLPLIMLWERHIGKSQVHLSGKQDQSHSLLESFNFAIAGDNFTVTLPVSLKSQNKAKLALKKNKSNRVVPRQLKDIQPLPKKESSRMNVDYQHQTKTVMTSLVSFKFSSLLTSIHSVAASTLGQCFVGVQNNENLSIVFSLSQTATTMKLADGVNPSLLVLIDWLHSTSLPLRQVIVTMLQEYLVKQSDDDCREILDTVLHRFDDWDVMLPVAFLVAKRVSLKESLMIELVRHLFPVIVDRSETLELLSEVFDQFVKILPNISDFYSQIIAGLKSKKVPENVLMRFAWTNPIQFFDEAAKTDQCLRLVEFMFKRFVDTDRSMLFKFLLHILEQSLSSKSLGFDTAKVFDIIAERVVYIGHGKQRVVFGRDDGTLLLISGDTAQVIWEMRVSANPITFVSVSPDSQRFIAIVERDRVVMWFALNFKKTKSGPCEMIGTHEALYKVAPVKGVWKSNTTVALWSQYEQLQELRAPKQSIFSFRR